MVGNSLRQASSRCLEAVSHTSQVRAGQVGSDQVSHVSQVRSIVCLVTIVLGFQRFYLTVWLVFFLFQEVFSDNYVLALNCSNVSHDQAFPERLFLLGMVSVPS